MADNTQTDLTDATVIINFINSLVQSGFVSEMIALVQQLESLFTPAAKAQISAAMVSALASAVKGK